MGCAFLTPQDIPAQDAPKPGSTLAVLQSTQGLGNMRPHLEPSNPPSSTASCPQSALQPLQTTTRRNYFNILVFEIKNYPPFTDYKTSPDSPL